MKMFSLFTFSLLFGVFFHASRSQELCANMPDFMTSANRFNPAAIVGGQDAPSPIPWQVSVQDSAQDFHFCGATILNEITLLSAAHCFFGSPTTGLLIRAGSTQKSTGGQTRIITGIIWNDNPGFEYNSETPSANDFVILKLDSPLEFNNDVQPACLPPSADYLDVNTGAERCFTSGWGALFADLVTNGWCAKLYQDGDFGLPEFSVTETDLFNLYEFNDAVSSVKVNDGCTLNLYSDYDLSGYKYSLTKNDAFLDDNDQASSLSCHCEKIGPPPETCQYVRVPAISNAACTDFYNDFFGSVGLIPDDAICAGDDISGKGSCFGDSGGPLVCNEDGKAVIVGITSFGAGDACGDIPSGFARVTHVLSWIQDNLQAECKDKKAKKFCEKQKKMNKCKKEKIYKQCKKTCDECGAQPPPPEECEDQKPKKVCKRQKDKGKCKKASNKKKCKKTCEHC